VQAPTKSKPIVNLKTAKALGLAVPPLTAWTSRQGDRIEIPFAAAHESVQDPTRTLAHTQQSKIGYDAIALRPRIQCKGPQFTAMAVLKKPKVIPRTATPLQSRGVSER
jgi:hypothetical protein